MKFRNAYSLIFGCLCFIGLQNPLFAQQKPPQPPRPMSVMPLQNLNFGTFCVGSSGGNVTLDQRGGRVVTGDIILLSSLTSPATFDINVEPGTPISLAVGFDAVLTDGNGHNITLQIEHNIFVATGAQRTLVSIGGTLLIGPATPPGSYVGSFFITFVQE